VAASPRCAACPGVRADEVVRFAGGEEGLALDLRRDDVGVVLLSPDAGIGAGDEVERTGGVLDVPVGEALLGRVVDPLGSTARRQGTRAQPTPLAHGAARADDPRARRCARRCRRASRSSTRSSRSGAGSAS
jgi:F0F1-type ATP synthase alpha subunit